MFDDVITEVYEFDPGNNAVTLSELITIIKAVQLGFQEELFLTLPVDVKRHFKKVVYVNGIKQESSEH